MYPQGNGTILPIAGDLVCRCQCISTHRWALHVVHLGAKSPPSPCSSAWGITVPSSLLSPQEDNCIDYGEGVCWQERLTRSASQFNFTYRYTDDVLSINNPDFENYLGQMYPLSLRSKTRRSATLLLPTWIYSCQSVGTVNFALPFTTNVTISISTLQTLRSWVATSHPCPPMAFLSYSLSDTPGLAPLMKVLFGG